MIDTKELKEFFQADENKAILQEIAKEHGFEAPDDIQGLKSKNAELIGKMKKLSDRAKELEDKISGIDFEEYEELKVKKDKSNPDDKTLRELKKLQSDLEKERGEKTRLTGDFHRLLKEQALSRAFKESNIDPIHESLLQSAFLGKARIDDDLQVIIDDGGLGLPIKDFFKQWSESETGKVYVAKPINAGTQSGPFSGKGSKISRADFESMSPESRQQAVKDGMKIID